ncbi:antizyme inhibitor 1a [Engraulis encrasicolus]|uniref:antizyme inhibitor 1a n=1 Tax=Engraulis encrasicolus TaxID=184585 RepID=UPI002FD79DD4
MKGLVEEVHYSVDLLEGGTALSDVIDNHIYQQTLSQKNAFFVADLGVILSQHGRWRTCMSEVRPFYPVRCNSSSAVVELLAALGCGFICSNKCELELVKGFGISSEDIILGGGCKQLSLIKYAAKNNVNLLLCDNEAELRKISRCHPKARLVLQVAVAAAASSEGEEVSIEIGSTLKDCRHLLEVAKELKLQVVGAKFHVPSGCQDPEVYVHAVSDARCVFDMGEELGFHMSILDVGGGFNGSDNQLEKVHGALRPMLDKYFPPSCGVSLLAEPGSYYVSSAFTLAVNIIAKKVVARDRPEEPHDSVCGSDEPEFLYYMNDGVYGSFAYKLLEGSIPAPAVHKAVSPEEPLFSSSLWGPSMDGLDQVVESCLLPELSIGDWLLFSNTGDNSLGGASDELKPPVYYMISASDWYEMQDLGVSLDTSMKNFSLVPCSLPSAAHTPTAVSTPA